MTSVGLFMFGDECQQDNGSIVAINLRPAKKTSTCFVSE